MSKIIDTAQPNLLRHVFPTYRVPRVSFAEGALQVDVPQQGWCVDSTLAQGTLALEQPTLEHARRLLELMDRLDSQSGLVRMVEIRVEGPVGRDLLEMALERHNQSSRLEPVAVVATSTEALRSLEGLQPREVGFDVAASDFQNHLGQNGSRSEQAARLIAMIDACLDQQYQPRLDLVDMTRCDLEGYVFPLLETCLGHLARHGTAQLKLRLCDTMGLGLPWSTAPVPRSVPRLMHTIRHALGLLPQQLEFLGANDLGLGLPNALAAILSGCSGVVCSVGGVGDRGGIAPIELVLIHLGGLSGCDCDLTVVPQLLSMLEPLGLSVDNHHPIWGEEALITSHLPTAHPLDQAGELLAPFDTNKLAGCAPRVVVRPQSGPLGIAHLIRHEFRHTRSAPQGREEPEFRHTRSAPQGREEPEFRHTRSAPQGREDRRAEFRTCEIQPDDEAVRAIHRWATERGLKEIAWESIEPRVRELLPQLFEQEADAD